MLPTGQGSIKLFRFSGITVFLHWSWFVVAAIELSARKGIYASPVWNVLEYLALFLIVMLHEFGHALACRQVGGEANQIVLWPLGGVAYVNPPQRPGATLWSIAAGPLVNVVLVFVLYGLMHLAFPSIWPDAESSIAKDAVNCLTAISVINLILLIFNMLPVYPLDGGQILRALLWFVLGRAKSLMVAAGIGFVGVAGIALWAVYERSIWIGIMALFIGSNCWRGWQHAQALTQLEKVPRHTGYACPSCHTAPPQVAFWQCGKCATMFDTFASQAACPNCGTQFEATKCIDCGATTPFAAWSPPATT